MILKNYAIIFPEYFTSHECELIHAVANTVDIVPGLVGNLDKDPDAPPDHLDGKDDNYIRQSDVKWLEHNIMPDEIQQRITDGINQASIEGDWLHQWDHVENHQYTIYHHRPDSKVTGDFYTWHTDAGQDAQSHGGRVRKLSSTIQLSYPDEYEGGNFQWIEPVGIFDRLKSTGTQNINVDPYIKTAPFSAKARGTLIVFPSFVHHQVTPVTRGRRISLVSWYHGQPYV